MDYLYENLGEDRFQELCQSLLIREFPNVQCFPIRQPDGGRDAVAFINLPKKTSKKENPFLVFQVKYVRKPLAESDPHKWLIEILQKEAPKLSELVPKGAIAYYLLTNVPGTAHLDTGAIDKVNQLLSEGLKGIEVKSYCWWRDDLNRRMDNAYDLKWVYPEIMGGTDLLRLIIEGGLSEHKDRRASAIKAFIRKQYSDDEDVRFKQIELHNKLLDQMLGISVSTLYTYLPKNLLQVALDEGIGRRYFPLDDVERLIEDRDNLKQHCVTTKEVASICKVSKESVYAWVEAGVLRPASGSGAVSLVHNLYRRSDVEKLYAEREAFKARRVSEGRSARFGRPAGPNWQPVKNKVGPRIEQLVKKWSAKPNGKPVSGQRLHRQLVKEGYRVGINTIYVCLRELRQQASQH